MIRARGIAWGWCCNGLGALTKHGGISSGVSASAGRSGDERDVGAVGGVSGTERKMSVRQSNSGRADYGLDAPGLVRFFLIFGFALLAGGIGLIMWRKNPWLIVIGFTLFFPGLTF